MLLIRGILAVSGSIGELRLGDISGNSGYSGIVENRVLDYLSLLNYSKGLESAIIVVEY